MKVGRFSCLLQGQIQLFRTIIVELKYTKTLADTKQFASPRFLYYLQNLLSILQIPRKYKNG